MAAKRRVYYLLLLAAGFYFVMLYDFRELRFLLCCIVVIPLVSLAILILSALFCKVSLEAEQDIISRGEPTRLNVTVENRGLFPISRVFVSICRREPNSKKVKMKQWLHGIGRNRIESIAFEMCASHCGCASYTVIRACAFDYLGIFSFPIRKRRKSVKICVSPIVAPIWPGEEGMAALASREKDGDMLLRDFQSGDSLHRVYWKLLVKTEDLQVRDFEHSNSVTLFLHFSPELKKKAQDWDRYLDRACSTLWFMIENSVVMQTLPKVAWAQDGRLLEYEVPDLDALKAWIYAMLMQNDIGLPLAEEEVSFVREGCRLEEDCKLYLGEQCVYGYEEEEQCESRWSGSTDRSDRTDI